MWNENIKIICNNVSKEALYYKEVHNYASSYYNSMENISSISSIVIQGFVATFNFATIGFNTLTPNNVLFRVITGIILYSLAGMDTIKKFIEPSKKSIVHNYASKRYSTLFHTIQKQLSMEPGERQRGVDYIEWITGEIDSLKISTPDMPTFIKKKFTYPTLVEIISTDEIPNITIKSIIDIKKEKDSDLESNNSDNIILNRFKNIGRFFA